MSLTARQERANTAARGEGAARMPSPGLDWLWQQLRDVPRPHVLDCGPIHQASLNVLFRRKAKVYVADLVSPAQRGNPKYWDRSKKVPVFLTDAFLGQIPAIPQDSLHAVLCWHLLDVVPPQAVAPAVERLYGLLEPGGVLFALLRQPYLPAGAESASWLENLNYFSTEPGAKKPFIYPVVTNRDMERLFPPGSVKIFLTRSGRREVVAMK